MDLKHNVARPVSAVSVAGMIAFHGWGTDEVVAQPDVEIDIQPPQYVRSAVITVSGSAIIVASGTAFTVGSTSYLFTCCASGFVVKPL